MERTALRKLAASARERLEEGVRRQLGAGASNRSSRAVEDVASSLFVHLITTWFQEENGYPPTGAVSDLSGSSVHPRLSGRLTEEELVFQDLRELCPAVKRQVETLGWLFQYYTAARRERVYARLKKGEKISAQTLPVATQVFTPHWIARYMVENTLGRLWLESHPTTFLEKRWTYYIKRSGHGGKKSNDAGLQDPTRIRFLDPACGTGHILTCAFDVLWDIYCFYGYSEREIPALILQHNLYGLDIDRQAARLSSFALVMKAREKNPDFDSYKVEPHIFSLPGEAGSLARGAEGGLPAREGLPGNGYDVIVSNPPYLRGRYLNPGLKKLCREYYRAGKCDLFAAFILRCLELARPGGLVGMMTPFVWMFLSSYRHLRRHIIESKQIESLIQLEYSAFSEATVPVCTFVLRNEPGDRKGVYIRLAGFSGSAAQAPAVLAALADPGANYRYEISPSEFSHLPGSPIAYWASAAVRKVFATAPPLREFAPAKAGLQTSNNRRFVRFWHEVEWGKIGFGCKDREETLRSGKKWFPYNKGGSFRKWYGNYRHVVNWADDGEEIKRFVAERYLYLKGRWEWVVKNQDYYFQPGITWTDVSSSKFGVRYLPAGFIFDVKGSCLFPPERDILLLLALLCSKPAAHFAGMLNPTLSFQVGNAGSLPVILPPEGTQRNRVENLAKRCLQLAREDWESLETSWGFRQHPVLRIGSTHSITKAFDHWSARQERHFAEMKKQEEELNSMFVHLYGLEGELSPNLKEGDVTISRPDRVREVKSFLSYAVGCMLGRYCLDREGIAYAGGEWLDSSYSRYSPAPFGIIPILDGEYSAEDAVCRLVEFLRVVFGAENAEESLSFIAAHLSPRQNDTPGETVRRYFLGHFYADHVQLYRKRPIYWFFTSGPRRAFNALVYLHRFDSNTLKILRTRYLRPVQCQLRRQYTALVSGGKSKSMSGQDRKLKANLAEIDRYDVRLAELAADPPEVDLDAGVRVNYDRFSSVLAPL